MDLSYPYPRDDGLSNFEQAPPILGLMYSNDSLHQRKTLFLIIKSWSGALEPSEIAYMRIYFSC